MRAVVTYPYRDKDTGEVRYAGEAVELTSQRYAELSSKGYVGAAAPAVDAGEAPEPGREPGLEKNPEPGEGEAAGEMTASQLRAAIEAKGGFAPKKATKAQLASILGTL